jgi:EpsI family protein
MISRAIIVVLLLAVAAVFGARADADETPIDRQPLTALPYEMDGWDGRDARPFPDDVVALLGVDDYVHRTYLNDAGVPVSLYAGYYNSQRQGDTIHSPQNCLPGAGWRPISSAIVSLPTARGPVSVNQYVIQKGLDKQVVLYWYQGRGRVVANEYRNKLLMMWDAATERRTNGGLVRVMTPVRPGGDAAAEAAAFATTLLPRLERLMP